MKFSHTLFVLTLYALLPAFGTAQSPPANSFFVVHCDPDYADFPHFNKLRKMVHIADQHQVPLTLEMSPQWVDFILADPARIDTIRTWQANGHEIAAHHHGIFHCFYDGYTNYPPDSLILHQLSMGAGCAQDTSSIPMNVFWEKLDELAGDSLMLTWGSSDEHPAVDMYPNIPYRTDGGRDYPEQGFSNPYVATHGPTVIGSTTYGPYTVCSIDYYFIDEMEEVNQMIALYNDSLGFSGDYSVVGVVTHVFDFAEADNTFPPENNYFNVWMNFIEGKGCKTVRKILRESGVCESTATQTALSTEKTFDIYPNPARDFVVISLQELQAQELYLFNANGQKVLQLDLQEGQQELSLPLQHLPKGIYFIQIRTDKSVVSKRFLAQ